MLPIRKVCKLIGSFCKSSVHILFAPLLLALFLSSPGLAQDFSIVILADGEEARLMNQLQSTRARLKFNPDQLRLRQVHRRNTPNFDALLSRLGVKASELPALGTCLIAKNGTTQRFVGDAFARRAEASDVPRVVQSHLRVSGLSAGLLPPFFMADTLPIPVEKGPVLENLRFEASGSPLNTTNMAIRVKNDSFSTLRELQVIFYLLVDGQWLPVAEQTIDKIASQESRTVDVVKDSRELKLVDAAGSAISCRYRVELKVSGREAIVREGRFSPSEEPVS